MKSVTIISHTAHYINEKNQVVGLTQTVTEINHLLEIFDSIEHVAMLHNGPVPSNTSAYSSDNIKFIPLPALGGRGLKTKSKIAFSIPTVLKTIKSSLSRTSYFQFRAPTGIGVFVIPFLIINKSHKGWFKYAGNWQQKKAPLAYRWQRWLLKHQRRTVTINSSPTTLTKNCLAFENPCLTDNDFKQGQLVRTKKTFKKNAIQLCFIGRIEEEKGFDLMIEGLSNLHPFEKKQIEVVHIVGHSRDIEAYKKRCNEIDITFLFHGLLSRNEVQSILSQSHAIILPSQSEGFPKVIAEALNFGCVPMVSRVSVIECYIKHGKNGLLFSSLTIEEVTQQIRSFLSLSTLDFQTLVETDTELIERFTYSYYNQRLSNEVLVDM